MLTASRFWVMRCTFCVVPCKIWSCPSPCNAHNVTNPPDFSFWIWLLLSRVPNASCEAMPRMHTRHTIQYDSIKRQVLVNHFLYCGPTMRPPSQVRCCMCSQLFSFGNYVLILWMFWLLFLSTDTDFAMPAYQDKNLLISAILYKPTARPFVQQQSDATPWFNSTTLSYRCPTSSVNKYGIIYGSHCLALLYSISLW